MRTNKSKVSQSNSICLIRRREKDEIYCANLIFIHPLKTNIMKKIIFLCGMLLILMSVTKAFAYQDYDAGTHYSMHCVDNAVVPTIEIEISDPYCCLVTVYNWSYVCRMMSAELLIESRCNSPPLEI
jgi:hypothetical protein